MSAAHALELDNWIHSGGFAEAVVRLAVAGLSRAPGGPRGLWLDGPVWTDDPRLAAVPRTERRALVAEQASIVRCNPDEAIDTLTVLLPDAADRSRALVLARRLARNGRALDPGVEARAVRVLGLLMVNGALRPRAPRPRALSQPPAARPAPALAGMSA